MSGVFGMPGWDWSIGMYAVIGLPLTFLLPDPLFGVTIAFLLALTYDGERT